MTTLRELGQKQEQAQLSDVNARLEPLKTTRASQSEPPQVQSTTTIRTTNHRQDINHPGWINTQALVGTGLDESQANKICNIYEDVEMERLYLRNRAVHEGWIGDEGYH